MIRALALCLCAATPLLAEPDVPYDEPGRGSHLRSDLLDAIRPVAEEQLGAPVEFVVTTLRHRGGVAFGILEPQRPGGGTIVWEDTAMAAAGQNEDAYDGLRMDVFWRADGADWTVVDWDIGATDLWYAGPGSCGAFASVIPEYCEGTS